MSGLGRWVVRWRKWIPAVFVPAVIAAGILGSSAVDDLSIGGIFDPDAESTTASELLEERFDGGDPNVVMLVTAADGDVDAPDVAADGVDLTERLGDERDVVYAGSYWTMGTPAPLRSEDGDRALVVARLAGDEDEVAARIPDLAEDYSVETEAISVEVGGQAAVLDEVGEQVENDLAAIEALSLGLTLVLLLLVFRSVVAALLPLTLGVLAVVSTLPLLGAIASVTDVSIFALNLATVLGIGLSIDYGLLMVSRFREERRRGLDPHPAVVRTVETAGRTVMFSALTVASSLAALLLFPMYYLRSMAYGGAAVVVFAAVTATVLLPAVLALLGDRVEWGTILRRRRAELGDASGMWHRIATVVMGRPIVLGGIVALLLLGLASSFLRVEFALSGDQVLPESSSIRQVHDTLRSDFPGDEAAALSVVMPDADPDATGDIGDYAAELSGMSGVDRADALTGTYVDGALVGEPDAASLRFRAPDGREGVWLSVVPDAGRSAADSEAIVHEIRDGGAPWPVQVTGEAAQLVDTKDAISGRLPLAAGAIALVTFVLLFLMTASVVAPIKALITNMLGLSATFGALVLIFQDGFLSGQLGFTPGPIEVTTPILMFCIAFGLAIDYEVFLLSRAKEEYDLVGDNATAVVTGVERTGRIITAAALLLSVVFVSLAAASQITFMTMFGVGLTLAVLIDAVLVRSVIVPSFMSLAGDANWWCPRWLRRLVFEERGTPEPLEPVS